MYLLQWGVFVYTAGAADKIHGTTLKMFADLQGIPIGREPIGVVGLIIPWNIPAQIFAYKVVAKAKAKVVGDPFDPNVQQGPQADINQLRRYFIYRAWKRGRVLQFLTGGKPLDRKG
nr:aldehyde dehydrogenase family 2 member C4-like [Ipomoea batatas]